ncbi:hypothetical protein [Ligilactobacillus sp. LYQ60]
MEHITSGVNRGRITIEEMGNWWFFITEIKHVLMPFLLFNHSIDLSQDK